MRGEKHREKKGMWNFLFEEEAREGSRREQEEAPPGESREEKPDRAEEEAPPVPPVPRHTVEDGKTVVLVMQSLLCCLLLIVALVARQGAPEEFGRFAGEMGNLLQGESLLSQEWTSSLLGQGEDWLADRGLAFWREGADEDPKSIPHEEPLDEELPHGEETGQGAGLDDGGDLPEGDLGGQGGEQRVQVTMIRDTASYEAPDWASFSPVFFSRRMTQPVSGPVTSPYGYRTHPITGELDFHTGVDLAVAEGTPVAAALGGQVIEVGCDQIYGNYIVLAHNNISTKYAHCSQILAQVDAWVRQGERIALSGNTGLSTGPHLHFEVQVDGSTVDPAWAFPQWEGQP